MNLVKLIATLMLSGLCLNATPTVAQTYEVDVRPSGLPAFTDCMTFEKEGKFRLGRDPLKLSWTEDNFGGFPSGFMATTMGGDRGGTPLRLTFHGRIYNGQLVFGDAVNSYGQTYVFHGVANESCETLGAPTAGSSEYSALPVFPFAPVYAWPDYENPEPVPERLAASFGAANADSPYARVFEPPYDCFGFDCGLPPQPKRANTLTNPAVEVESPFGDLYRPVYEPKRSDALSDSVGETEWSFGGVVEPPVDCFGWDCGPPPQPKSPGDSTTQRSAVAGMSYIVILASHDNGAEWIGDCWKFAADGRLESKIGTELIWRINSNNLDATSFQAVGSGGSQHGLGFHGRAFRGSSMELSGIRSFRDDVTRFSGLAYRVPGC